MRKPQIFPWNIVSNILPIKKECIIPLIMRGTRVVIFSATHITHTHHFYDMTYFVWPPINTNQAQEGRKNKQKLKPNQKPHTSYKHLIKIKFFCLVTYMRDNKQLGCCKVAAKNCSINTQRRYSKHA